MRAHPPRLGGLLGDLAALLRGECFGASAPALLAAGALSLVHVGLFDLAGRDLGDVQRVGEHVGRALLSVRSSDHQQPSVIKHPIA